MGSYMRLYMGTSMYEKTIFVNESNSKKALELIECIHQKASSDDVNDSIENPNDTVFDHNSGIKLKRSIASILLAVMVFFMVFSFIILMIYLFIFNLFY